MGVPNSASSDSESLTKNQTVSTDARTDTVAAEADSQSVSSEATDSLVVTKSFGVRDSEIIANEINTIPRKIVYFSTIFLCFYIVNVEGTALGVFMSYATDSYKQHSLMSTVGVIRGVVASASLPFYARLADTYGRFWLILVSLVSRVVGIIIQSQATNVQKYAGGTVFQSFGHAGTMVLLQISLSDASSLRYRLLALGVANCQTIINTWSSGNLVTSLLQNRSWKFGIAMWAYVTPLVFLPFLSFYLYIWFHAWHTEPYQRLKQDRINYFIQRFPSVAPFYSGDAFKCSKRRKVLRAFKFLGLAFYHNFTLIFWYIDFIGCLLIAVILGLILVPLTLAGGRKSKWQEGEIIGPLILGFVLIPFFVLWELKITNRPIISFKVMRNRGVWAAYIVSILNNFAYSVVNSYAYPVLFVGMNASSTVATRTPSLVEFVNALTILGLGLVVTRIRRSKAFILFGCAVLFVAMGLFVHFRGSNDGIRGKYFRDGIAISMCILGFSQAFLNRLVVVSAQSCTSHEYMGIVTALFSSFYRVGHTLGASVSGAIWTQEMYGHIRDKMIELGVNETMAQTAYASPYQFAALNKWGSPPRRAVSMAYAEIQKALSITGLCLCVPILVAIFFLRDHILIDAQNLDDENITSESLEKGRTSADRVESKAAFTNDKDYILDFLKSLIGRRPKLV